jgi:flagellar export protein FliJ
MRRFRFRLERLLWHRHTLEGQAEQALAEALRRERDLAEALAQVLARQEAEAVGVRQALAEPTPGQDMRLHVQYVAALDARRRLLADHLRLAQVTSAERRTTLLGRRRDREVVAQLRTRALLRYQLSAEREAQRELDEIAGIRHLNQASPTA